MLMRLRPNIGPLDSTFPLFEAPRLRVVAQGEGVPVARRAPALTIEVANLAHEPGEVRDVNAGYMYTNLLIRGRVRQKGSPATAPRACRSSKPALRARCGRVGHLEYRPASTGGKCR